MIPGDETEVDSSQEGDLRFLNISDSQAEDIGEVISSDGSRQILEYIYTEPASSSEVADELNISIQNASYHLKKLLEAELIQVAGTKYSEKGAEMNIYAPSESPIVLFVGNNNRKDSFIDLLKRASGAIGVLLVVSFVVGIVVDGSMLFGIQNNASTGDPATTIPVAIGFLCGGLFILSLIEIFRVRRQ